MSDDIWTARQKSDRTAWVTLTGFPGPVKVKLRHWTSFEQIEREDESLRAVRESGAEPTAVFPYWQAHAAQVATAIVDWEIPSAAIPYLYEEADDQYADAPLPFSAEAAVGLLRANFAFYAQVRPAVSSRDLFLPAHLRKNSSGSPASD